jgi:hypothetical protein
MFEVWYEIGVWIRCLKDFKMPDFLNMKRYDNLSDDDDLAFFSVFTLSHKRISKMYDIYEEQEEKSEKKMEKNGFFKGVLNDEEKQGLKKVWDVLEKIPGIRPLQLAILYGGCSSHGDPKINCGFESGWDSSQVIPCWWTDQFETLDVKIKKRIV